MLTGRYAVVISVCRPPRWSVGVTTFGLVSTSVFTVVHSPSVAGFRTQSGILSREKLDCAAVGFQHSSLHLGD